MTPAEPLLDPNGEPTAQAQHETRGGELGWPRGAGVRSGKSGDGDLLVTVDVVIPQRLTEPMKAAVEALRDATADIDLRADLFGQG